MNDSIDFLSDLFGRLDSQGYEKSLCFPCVNGNNMPNLSTHCTIGYLYPLAGENPILGKEMLSLEKIAAVRLGKTEILTTALGALKLGEMLEHPGKSEAERQKLHDELSQITNMRG